MKNTWFLAEDTVLGMDDKGLIFNLMTKEQLIFAEAPNPIQIQFIKWIGVKTIAVIFERKFELSFHFAGFELPTLRSKKNTWPHSH